MVEGAARKMTLRMAAQRLGCSIEWVRKRVDENGVPVERMAGRRGTILIAEDSLPLLGAPGRSFYSKPSAKTHKPSFKPERRNSADGQAEPAGRKWSMRSAVAAAMKAAVDHGWRPAGKADRAIASAIFEYLDG